MNYGRKVYIFGAHGRLNTVHELSNLKIGGGLDDVWLNLKSDKLHVIDYKSTSLKSPDRELSIDEPWKCHIKDKWIYMYGFSSRMNFIVDDIGYFLYCNADRFSRCDFLQKKMLL